MRQSQQHTKAECHTYTFTHQIIFFSCLNHIRKDQFIREFKEEKIISTVSLWLVGGAVASSPARKTKPKVICVSLVPTCLSFKYVAMRGKCQYESSDWTFNSTYRYHWLDAKLFPPWSHFAVTLWNISDFAAFFFNNNTSPLIKNTRLCFCLYFYS